MAPEEIFKILADKFGDKLGETNCTARRPYACVSAEAWLEVAAFLRDDSRLRLNVLNSITALDLLADDKLACVYDLSSIDISQGEELITKTLLFAVRIVVDRNDPKIPSVAHLWPAANWHEREAYDMMGIVFENHPDPRRILCPDDWVGFPLRKDYEYPLEYHDIPGTTEYELPNPRH